MGLMRFAAGDDGAAAVEYALIVTLIAAAVIGTAQLLGGAVLALFSMAAGLLP